MIVVADAGPLRYLIVIGRVELIVRLYGQIVVPPGVLLELRHASAPEEVRRWADDLPNWVSIREALKPRDDLRLGSGESAAISLLLEVGGLLASDDRDAVELARRLGLRAIGTLGILIEAHREGWDDIETALAALSTTNFRVSEDVLRLVRQRARR